MLDDTNGYSVYTAPVPILQNGRHPLGFAVILPLTAMLIAGTGGFFSSANIEMANSMTVAPLIEVVGPARQSERNLSFAQRLIRVRDVFGLSMSDLASVFGVSRQAAYAWLNGTTPRLEAVEKVSQLSPHAVHFGTLDPLQVRTFLRRPVLEDRTLLDLLRSGQLLDYAFSEVERTISSERFSRLKAGFRPSGTLQRERLPEISSVISERDS